MPIVKEHIQAAQVKQCRIYNCPDQPREFKPSDGVLLLLPGANSKLLARSQGPYTTVERVGPVEYHLQQLGRQPLTRTFHINFLKCWIEQVHALTAYTVSPRLDEWVHIESDWSPLQQQDLRELED